MFIDEIKDINSQKVKIFSDNGIAFVLYKGDLSKYGIKTGEVDDSVIDEILTELLPKRALARALKIITGRDMTEKMLFDKLSDDGYSDEVCEGVIEKLKAERLIDDERFIRGYIESKSLKKSKRDIIAALYEKGIDSDKASSVYDELYSEGELTSEIDLIKALFNKRRFDPENADYEECRKEIQYLLRKGFSFDSIRSAMKGL
ncbi:MAG: regulatory protein RecX [Lachnospiraceae bacterium]|nr:regulatory protein RecX [Lachnospiraceae bacterium]